MDASRRFQGGHTCADPESFVRGGLNLTKKNLLYLS